MWMQAGHADASSGCGNTSARTVPCVMLDKYTTEIWNAVNVYSNHMFLSVGGV